MRLHFTRRSLQHLDEIRAYIAPHDAGAANHVIARIRASIEVLLRHPDAGRVGRIPGTRELIVPRTPYVVPYRVSGDRIEILAILHGARAWPSAGP